MPPLEPSDQSSEEVLQANRLPAGRKLGTLQKLLIVLTGILLGQAILYGPSLMGRKILLPLDILGLNRNYLPRTPEVEAMYPHNRETSDLIYLAEPSRRFVAGELQSGRLPLWNPSQFAGAPSTIPKFSPFFLLSALTTSPKILPWVQCLMAVVSGGGAWLFFRRILKVTFWPATFAAWGYPLTAFFVSWQACGGPVTSVVWLPWLLLAVDQVVRKPGVLSWIALGGATGLTLVGQLDIAAQVLLTSGLYGIWCLFSTFKSRPLSRPALTAVFGLTMGWILGFALAAPDVFPLMEYSRSGARMMLRGDGREERPPVGLAALPEVVMPRIYGSALRGSFLCLQKGEPNMLERASQAYTGIFATLLLAPLAFCDRKRRSLVLFLAGLGFLGLSWSLDVPGVVELMRMPGLNMLSHNRWVFATSFSILALAAIGLEVLVSGQLRRQRWFWLPAALFAGLGAWCVFRAISPPEPIASLLGSVVLKGKPISWIHDAGGVREVQAWFVRWHLIGAALCGLGVAGWWYFWNQKAASPRVGFALGALLSVDLLLYGFGQSAQCDPALYYPPIPVLEGVAKATPGRVVGFNCLPPRLAEMQGLWDIRGYDAVDPARLMDLMRTAVDPRSFFAREPSANTQWFYPPDDLQPPDGIRLPPVLDMLNVRYVIFRGPPPAGIQPAFQSFDYWVAVNHSVLPRAFIPRRVETVADPAERLQKLAGFNPREVAYVESEVALPNPCEGSATIISEIPTRVTLSLKMATPGLIVLADLWDKGWRAYLEGQPVPIQCVNHAIRGVVVPAGDQTLEFRYEPTTMKWSLRVAGLALMVVLVGLGFAAISRWRGSGQTPKA